MSNVQCSEAVQPGTITQDSVYADPPYATVHPEVMNRSNGIPLDQKQVIMETNANVCRAPAVQLGFQIPTCLGRHQGGTRAACHFFQFRIEDFYDGSFLGKAVISGQARSGREVG
jgi:16S rRNA G966 N2-methylase RsmD